jgi:hypothetical protein
MLWQVPPKHKTSVFSDHAGFIAKFRPRPEVCEPLLVYYHSLEHGHQHTNTRTAWNYGSMPSLSIPVGSERMPLHDPRMAYLENMKLILDYLVEEANKVKGYVLILIGECTRSIDDGVQSRIKSMRDKELKKYNFGRVNASKREYANGLKKPTGEGQGVHALIGYLISPKDSKAKVELRADLLSIEENGTEVVQNILTLEYGTGNSAEKHAFTHLLNGKENSLAEALEDNGYASVGGDLNNIKKMIGKELVQTVDMTGTRMSTGSNSTVTKMYDKIVILAPKLLGKRTKRTW